MTTKTQTKQLAVIKTGGKQYLVKAGDKIKIEKISALQDQEVIFKEVLLLIEGEKATFGNPFVEKAKVIARIVRQEKAKKITILKYKSKTRYKVKKGHRQPQSLVEILKIQTPGQSIARDIAKNKAERR